MRPRLTDMRHELVKLIDWDFFEAEWAGFFPSHTGRPATSPRLVAGLLYLQHADRLSDEAVVARWAENLYWQHFCGETFFQHRFPLRSLVAHAVAQADWRGGRRVAADQDDQGGP